MTQKDCLPGAQRSLPAHVYNRSSDISALFPSTAGDLNVIPR